jgi:hypothetical protein
MPTPLYLFLGGEGGGGVMCVLSLYCTLTLKSNDIEPTNEELEKYFVDDHDIHSIAQDGFNDPLAAIDILKRTSSAARIELNRSITFTEEVNGPLDLRVLPSTIADAGEGLFCMSPCAKGDVICYYTGKFPHMSNAITSMI